MNVSQWMRALADEDEACVVPQVVDHAVMTAWDVQCAAIPPHNQPAWRARPRIVLAGVAASVLIGGFALFPRMGLVLEPKPADSPVQRVESVAVPTLEAGDPAMPSRATTRRALPSAPRARRIPVAPPPAQGGFVLVPETSTSGQLMMMRVRMPRRAFASLGVPVANPEGDGYVDVDILVGEDGVARSIRRATAVNDAAAADWVSGNR